MNKDLKNSTSKEQEEKKAWAEKQKHLFAFQELKYVLKKRWKLNIL